MTAVIMRMERTAASLRRHAAGSTDASVAHWLLALALVLDGHKRAGAARSARSLKREVFAAGTGKPCASGIGCAPTPVNRQAMPSQAGRDLRHRHARFPKPEQNFFVGDLHQPVR